MGKKRFLARILLCFFLMVVLMIAGCASSSDPTLSYNIDGYILTEGDIGVPDVTIDLSGADNVIIETTSTDENGRYVFTGLSDGLYTVTPSRTGCTFLHGFETAHDVTITGASVTCPDFVATCTP
jgi:hypothetical protein